MDFISYDILRALHIIAIVCWFAGLFYLPRLFVYHTAASDNAVKNTLSTMEAKLYKYIMNPSMVAVWLFGLWMVAQVPEWMSGQGWLHVKITLVVILTGFHHVLNHWRKQLAAGTCSKSEKFFRMMNEVPTVILIAAVFLAVLKPF